MTTYRVARIYDEPRRDDGCRVLVDRVWPRGMTKERAELDAWPRDVTPSTELRRWFHADRESRADEFRERYLAELRTSGAADHLAARLAEHPVVTLLTAVKDVEHCHVQVLLELLES